MFLGGTSSTCPPCRLIRVDPARVVLQRPLESLSMHRREPHAIRPHVVPKQVRDLLNQPRHGLHLVEVRTVPTPTNYALMHVPLRPTSAVLVCADRLDFVKYMRRPVLGHLDGHVR